MHFRDIYFIGILLFCTTLPLLAQEPETPEMRMSGEFNLAYSQSVLGGFGADFHRAISPIARFSSADDISHAPWPKVHVGLEGIFLVPLYQNRSIQLFSALGYSMRYSHERYNLRFSGSPAGIGDGASNAGQNISLNQDGFGSRRALDHILINAITNQFNFGVRIQHQQSRLYGNVGLGVLFYNPIHLEWHRTAYDVYGNQIDSATHSVRGNQAIRINEDGTNGQTGIHMLSLRGTSEVLFALSGRVGYGPFFLGLSYATNIRVHNLSVDIGFTLYPQFGGNK